MYDLAYFPYFLGGYITGLSGLVDVVLIFGAHIMVEQEREEALDCSRHDLDFILVVGAEVINVVTTPVAELLFSMLVSL